VTASPGGTVAPRRDACPRAGSMVTVATSDHDSQRCSLLPSGSSLGSEQLRWPSCQQAWEYACTRDHVAPLNMTASWLLQGAVTDDAARFAISEIGQRHAILRSHLLPAQGRVWQVVDADAVPALAVLDVRAWGPRHGYHAAMSWTRGALQKPRSLCDGELFTSSLWRLGPATWMLVVVVAHAVWDVASARLFIREFGAIASESRDGRENPSASAQQQFADVVSAERRRSEFAAPVDSWRRRLEDHQASRPRVCPAARCARPEFRFAATPLPTLSRPATDRLARLARECGASTAAGPLAAVLLLLADVTGCRQHAVGLCYANRDRAEHRTLIGCLAEHVPLVLEAAPTAPVRDVVRDAGSAIRDFRAAGVTMSGLFPETREQGPWRGDATCDVVLNYIAGGDRRMDYVCGETIAAHFLGHRTVQPVPARFLWDFAVAALTLEATRTGGLGGVVGYNAATMDRRKAEGLGLSLARILQMVSLFPDRDTAWLLARLRRWHDQ